MQVIIINNKRYLFNDESKGAEEYFTKLIAETPDAIVDFDKASLEDVLPKTVKQICRFTN